MCTDERGYRGASRRVNMAAGDCVHTTSDVDGGLCAHRSRGLGPVWLWCYMHFRTATLPWPVSARCHKAASPIPSPAGVPGGSGARGSLCPQAYGFGDGVAHAPTFAGAADAQLFDELGGQVDGHSFSASRAPASRSVGRLRRGIVLGKICSLHGQIELGRLDGGHLTLGHVEGANQRSGAILVHDMCRLQAPAGQGQHSGRGLCASGCVRTHGSASTPSPTQHARTCARCPP